MLKALQQQLVDFDIRTEQTVLLAISGGVDSMVLWDLFEKSGQKYSIAHVNFSLRAAASDADEELVKSRADELEVKCFIKKTDTKKIAKERKLSIQMAAREIRYDWFSELKKEFRIETLVTAHHLEDSIETFFINLNRGTGLKGLNGISSSKKLFRPLLAFSKTEIRTYASANKIPFREDVSNEEIKYERNWFRHEILEKWKNRNPSFLDTMKVNLERIDSAHQLLEDLMKEKLLPFQQNLANGVISLSKLKEEPHRKELLYRLLQPLDFTESQLSDLTQCIIDEASGKTFNSPVYSILLDRENILIRKQGERNTYDSILINEEQKEVEFLNKKLELKNFSSEDFTLNNLKGIEYFDLEKLNFPLELRKWEMGDWMIPLGMKGKKKISDILIDEKISLYEKEKTFVLCSAGSIVCLLGVRIDNRFKIDSSTKQILQLSLS